MYCIGCGRRIEDSAVLCPFCGTNVQALYAQADMPDGIDGDPDAERPVSIDGDPDANTPISAYPDHSVPAHRKTPNHAPNHTPNHALNHAANPATNPAPNPAPNPATNPAPKPAPKKPRDKKPVLLVLIIVIVCTAAFLLFIGPKVLGVQILPFDLFNITDPEEPADKPEESPVPDGPEDAVVYSAIPVESIVILVGDAMLIEAAGGTETPSQVFIAEAGDLILFKAMAEPPGAEKNLITEWAIADPDIAYFETANRFDAVLNAAAPGQTEVIFTAYTDEETKKDMITARIGIDIHDPGPPDTIPPYAGDVFVTSESKLGIFVRSDHVVNGEGNKINDGNKIGWIAGGDTDVELVSTGREYHEGGEGYWWFEVKIPKWYRDTKKQTENFDGKPLVGWVRSDVVKQIR